MPIGKLAYLIQPARRRRGEPGTGPGEPPSRRFREKPKDRVDSYLRESSPLPNRRAHGSAGVERGDEWVHARIDTSGVGVPDPEMQRDQVGMPEIKLGPGLRARRCALRFRRGVDKGPVNVMASGTEGAVLRPGQRWSGRLRCEDPLESTQFPAASGVLVDEDGWSCDGQTPSRPGS